MSLAMKHAPGARAAGSAKPTSGHRPMAHSGMANRVPSVTTRTCGISAPMPLRLCRNHETNAAAAAINCGLVGFTNIEAYRGSQAKWPRSLRSSCQDCKCRKELMKTHRRACGECEAWTWPAYCRAPRAPCQGPPHAAPPRAARGKACSGEAHGEARTSPCTARPTPRPIQMPSHSAA